MQQQCWTYMYMYHNINLILPIKHVKRPLLYVMDLFLKLKHRAIYQICCKSLQRLICHWFETIITILEYAKTIMGTDSNKKCWTKRYTYSFSLAYKIVQNVTGIDFWTNKNFATISYFHDHEVHNHIQCLISIYHFILVLINTLISIGLRFVLYKHFQSPASSAQDENNLITTD